MPVEVIYSKTFCLVASVASSLILVPFKKLCHIGIRTVINDSSFKLDMGIVLVMGYFCAFRPENRFYIKTCVDDDDEFDFEESRSCNIWRHCLLRLIKVITNDVCMSLLRLECYGLHVS